MPGDSGLSRFTREISYDGALELMLAQTPGEHLPPALAGLAVDRGYSVWVSVVRKFLAGLDVRFA